MKEMTNFIIAIAAAVAASAVATPDFAAAALATSSPSPFVSRARRSPKVPLAFGLFASVDGDATAASALNFGGKHKWLGGAVDDRGAVYGIPSHSKHVVCLSPPPTSSSGNNDANSGGNTGDYETHFLPLPPSIADGKFKWLRGIVANDVLYGIPAWSTDGVLRVDLKKWRALRRRREAVKSSEGHRDDDDDVDADDEQSPSPASVICLPEPYASVPGRKKMRWMWHGASLNANGTAIYCVPSNARHVLKVDLASSLPVTSLIPIRSHANHDTCGTHSDIDDEDDGADLESMLALTNKWYGGILGQDGAIYGIPYASNCVLRIDAASDVAEAIPVSDDNVEIQAGIKEYNWHGGAFAPSNGAIYAFPSHSPYVLKIDTTATTTTTTTTTAIGEKRPLLSLLPVIRAPYDTDPVTRYKWLGGCLGADGAVYGVPSDASSVLRIDPATKNNDGGYDDEDKVTTFGFVEGSGGRKGSSGYEEKNKFQGGVLGRDGFVYAMPSDSRAVLRIDTRPRYPPGEGEEGREKEGGDESSIFCDKGRVTCLGLTGGEGQRNDYPQPLPETKDKWQGGFVVPTGEIYGVPENCNRVLKVLPPQPRSPGDRSVGEASVVML